MSLFVLIDVSPVNPMATQHASLRKPKPAFSVHFRPHQIWVNEPISALCGR
jgi:hypothetical protein